MIETLTQIASNEATWLIIGILVKTFAPSWIPILGIGKKLVEELTELHEKSATPNKAIKKDAEQLGLKVAANLLEKKLS